MVNASRQPVVPPTVEPILARLQSEAPACFKGNDVRLIPDGYEERPFSHLLRVGICRNGAHRPDSYVFIKVFKPKAPDGIEKMRERVAHDFEMSRRIYEAMSGRDDLGAVRPVAYYADYLAIITEEIRGQTLLEHLRSSATWFPNARTLKELEQTMMTTGRWIRTFQEIDERADRISLTDVRTYIDVRLQRLVLVRRVEFTESDRRRVLAHIDSLIDLVHPADLREVLVHADLAPANIMVCDRRIVVLDFAMTKRGSFLHDLSRLFLQLELLRAKPQFRYRVVHTLQQGLLRGFDPSFTEEHPLFRLLLLLHHINHFGTLSLGHDAFPASLYNSRIRRMHWKWIQQQLRARG